MPASIILEAIGAELTGVALAAATFAINFVVSGIVARMFAVDQNSNSSIDNGVRQQVAPATTNSLPIVYGDAYLGGTFVDAVLTIDQKVMYYVMAISSISPNGQFLYNQSTTVNAGSFAVGTIYTITTVGSTNFTLIGASANTVGVTFICTGAGTGSGTATKGNFYYGDRIVTFDATDLTKVVSLTDGAGNVDSKISGNLYINLYTSTDAGVITNVTGTAPSTFMGGSDIATALRWAGTRQMNGLAFAIAKLTYSVEAGTTQLQPITFNVSHYLNNTNAAKPGDVWFDYIGNEAYGGGMLNTTMPTTVAGSFVVGSTYKIAALGTTSFTSIGAVSNNVGVWFTATGAGTGTGTAILSTLINRDSAIALNTYSDATITYTPSTGGSATQVRYRVNGVLDTGQNVLSNIDKIMLACDSWNQYNAASGQWTVVVNRDASSSFSFDDTNVIGEIKTSLIDISNSINQIEASFPNKMNRDQTDVVYLETPTGLLYANEPVNKYSCNFDLVNESVQATYIANRMLEQAREDLIVTINAAYPAIQVDAGDVVSLTNTAYGWNNKLFRAMKVSEISLPDGNLGASLDLSEYNATVYDDGSITQYSPTPNSNLASVQFFSGLNPPVVSTSRPAATVPNFDVQITTPAIGRVTAIGLFYTTVATPSNSDWTILDKFFAPTNGVLANSTTFTFPNMQLPANTYYFGALVLNETGQSAISGVSGSFNWLPSGTVGSQTAQVYLYQWALTTPSSPTGNSTYTWATATNSGYTGGAGWSVTIPTNPGTANYQLWQAGQGITAFAGTATTSVAWAGASITSIAQNGATGTTGANGFRTATLALFQWASSAPTTYPSGSSTYTWATGTFTNPATLNGWTQTPSSGSTGQSLYEIDQIYTDQLTTATSSVTWSATTVFVVGVVGAAGTPGTNGTNGTRTALLPLYQWASSVPTTYPSGSSTYTWATAAFTNPATLNGWTQTPSSGSPGQSLYEVIQIYTDQLTTTTSSVTWSASTNTLVGGYGGNGSRTAVLRLYQWASSGPTVFPSGTSTYTWATSAFTNPATLNSWTQTPGTGATGQSLYQTAQIFVDSLTTATSTVTWSASTSIIVGSAGTTGATGATGSAGATGATGNSAVICYALYTGNPTVTGAAVVKSGATLPATTDFSPTSATAFTSTVQTPGAGQAMFQSDGIYNAVANTTTWNTPYLSNLKVANLSAITADMGSITAGNITLDTSGFIRGGQTAYATGNGFFLGYSSTAYKFSIGTSTSYLTFDGTNLTLGGNINTTGTATFGGQTTYSGITYAAVFNTSYASTRGLTGYARSTSGNQEAGVEGYLSSTSATAGLGNAGVLARDIGTGTLSSGLYAESYFGQAIYATSIAGKALKLDGVMVTNNSTLVSNLNAERWNGIQAVTTVNNGVSGSLPTAYPPVTLTYNALKYLQVNVGGVTGYIPIYI